MNTTTQSTCSSPTAIANYFAALRFQTLYLNGNIDLKDFKNSFDLYLEDPLILPLATPSEALLTLTATESEFRDNYFAYWQHTNTEHFEVSAE